MQYNIVAEGTSALIMHSGLGIDPEQPVNRELAKLTSKKASVRTDTENVRIRDLETIKSLWLSEDGQRPAVPGAALRSCIEAAARKTKSGPDVREGLVMLSTTFHYDANRYGSTLDEIGKSAQFTVPVVVQRAHILRTRAKFDTPWHVEFSIDTDPDLIDKEKLRGWLDIGGRRIGLGDWRPQKSGSYGRFTTRSIEAAG